MHGKMRKQISCLRIRKEKPTDLGVCSRITLNRISKAFCRSNLQRSGPDPTCHCRVGRKAGSYEHKAEPLASVKSRYSIFTNIINCRHFYVHTVHID